MHTCGPVTTVAKEMWDALERTAGEASEERSHPRTLKLDHTLHDHLIRTESRLFILPTPLETAVTLEVEKLGGRARAVFGTCKIDRNLQVTPLWRVKLASGNRHRRFAKTLGGVRGRLLSVYVESESAVHRLAYTLTLREA